MEEWAFSDRGREGGREGVCGREREREMLIQDIFKYTQEQEKVEY